MSSCGGTFSDSHPRNMLVCPWRSSTAPALLLQLELTQRHALQQCMHMRPSLCASLPMHEQGVVALGSGSVDKCLLSDRSSTDRCCYEEAAHVSWLDSHVDSTRSIALEGNLLRWPASLLLKTFVTCTLSF